MRCKIEDSLKIMHLKIYRKKSLITGCFFRLFYTSKSMYKRKTQPVIMRL